MSRKITLRAPNGLTVETETDIVIAGLVSILTPEQQGLLVQNLLQMKTATVLKGAAAPTQMDTPAIVQP